MIEYHLTRADWLMLGFLLAVVIVGVVLAWCHRVNYTEGNPADEDWRNYGD